MTIHDNLNLNATQKLILLSATTQVSEASADALQKLLKSHIDWPFLIQYSVSQGTAPFLYKMIKNQHLESLMPEPVYKALEAGYYRTYSKNVLAQEALKEVLNAFNKASIKTLLIKGMASAQYIYKDPGLRPMSDIDLLVENNNLLIAEQILFDLGYKNACPYKSFKLRTLNIYNHLNAFTKANTKIELHHDLSSSHHIIRFPSEKVWDGVREVYLGNEKTHILKDEWNLIYLSIHLISHFIKKNIRLNNFIDMAELIKMKSNELNWDFIVGQSKIYNFSSPVFSAFSICRTYFNTPIPWGYTKAR